MIRFLIRQARTIAHYEQFIEDMLLMVNGNESERHIVRHSDISELAYDLAASVRDILWPREVKE